MNINFTKKSVRSADAKIMINRLNMALKDILGHDGTAHASYGDFEDDKAFFLIGYDKEKPVCCAGLRRIDDETGEIKRVYADHNKDGLGAKLMEAMENRAAEAGYSHLVLECREGNGHAISFYRKHGYSTCENYPPYEKEEDAVCLEKWI